MALWTKPNNASLITLQENVTTTVPLPLAQSSATVILLSGSFPAGMRLDGTDVKGTPREVARETTSTFVLRATYNGTFEDRTYKIVVQGEDLPVWETEADLLPAGANDAYYILDSAPVDFQLKVTDSDIEAGQTLEYFIGSKDGVLPPGIQLTKDGRLVGVVDPILAIERAAASGFYDDAGYDLNDQIGYDWSIRSTNGFESFFYDTTTFDLSVPTRSPKKLNRYYQFTVSASDGDTIARRTFRLYVVGDDFLRADNTIMQIGTGTFSADNTHIRTPIWITPGNLGYRRANNYVTLVLDIIDPNTLSGIVSYYLNTTNDDGTESILPPGLSLDATTGEIAGQVPYQPAITKEYKFSVTAQRNGYDVDTIVLQQFAFEATAAGNRQIKINKIGEYTQKAIDREFTAGGFTYKVISIDSSNTEYDVLTLDKDTKSELAKGTEINLGRITVTEVEVATSKKTFTVNILGEVDSTMAWTTASNLGSFPANYISTLSVKATTTVPKSIIIYTLESGSLPPGLSLSYDGEIIGKVKSFGTSSVSGLTVFDSQELTFDGNDTRFDRTFKFKIKARDQFGFSAIEREFSITLSDPDEKQYSNIYMVPLMTETKRNNFAGVVNDANIFLPEYVYRPNDKNFGLQPKIKMLTYSGIETKNAQEYVAKVSKHASRKKYVIGDLKTAVAYTPGTKDVVYEVVYLEVKDNADKLDKNLKHKKNIDIKTTEKFTINSSRYDSLFDEGFDATDSRLPIETRSGGEVINEFIVTLNIQTRSTVLQNEQIVAGELRLGVTSDLRIELRDGSGVSVPFDAGIVQSNKYRPDHANTVTTDINAVTVDSTLKRQKTVSNHTLLRDEFASIGETEKNFLPLWMRSQQEDAPGELGYVNAIVLCYCKPGTSKIIKNTIDFRKIDFKQYDLDIDRILIDSTTGNSEDQYIVFQNREYNT